MTDLSTNRGRMQRPRHQPEEVYAMRKRVPILLLLGQRSAEEVVGAIALIIGGTGQLQSKLQKYRC